MIIIGEIRIRGINHLTFNAAIIKIIQSLFPNEQICFYGEKNYIFHLKSMEPEFKKVKFISLPNIKHRKVTFVFRELLMFCEILYLHCLSNNKSVKLLFFLSISPFSQYFLEILKPFFFPKVNTLIILHELDWVIEKKLSIRWVYGYFMRSAINIRKRINLKYLLFGEIIKRNLAKINPYMKVDDFFWVDLPYPIDNNVENIKKLDNDVVFASIGTADIQRNVHWIFSVASAFEKQIKMGLSKFIIIGQLHKSMYDFANNLVLHSTSHEKIPQKDYDNQIKQVHYALFFRTDSYFSTTNYDLRASGALFDAIKYEKPIITIRNDYFEYYFKKFGNIGYLCKDIEEMKAKIRFIIEEKPQKEYQIQVENLRAAKQQLSPDNIQDQLQRQLKTWLN